jgi:hypothetical protein
MIIRKEYYRGWIICVQHLPNNLTNPGRPWLVQIWWCWPELVPASTGLEVYREYYVGESLESPPADGCRGAGQYCDTVHEWARKLVDNPSWNQGLVSNRPDPRLGWLALRPAPEPPAIPTKTEPEPGPVAPLPGTIPETKREETDMAEPNKPSWFYTFVLANWKTTWAALGAAIAVVVTRVSTAPAPLTRGEWITLTIEAAAIFAAGLFARDANKTSELSVGRVEVIEQKQVAAARPELGGGRNAT